MKGFDISHHNRLTDKNWSDLAKVNKFVIIRSQYGHKKDRMFTEHLTNAREHGLKVGAYCFFRTRSNLKEQFDLFNECIAEMKLQEGDFYPVIDLEHDTMQDGTLLPETWEQYSMFAESFYNDLIDVYGSVIVYTAPFFLVDKIKPSLTPNLQQAPLWVAHWNVKEPSMPKGKQWDMWQFTTDKNKNPTGQPLDLNIVKTESVNKLTIQKSNQNTMIDSSLVESKIKEHFDKLSAMNIDFMNQFNSFVKTFKG